MLSTLAYRPKARQIEAGTGKLLLIGENTRGKNGFKNRRSWIAATGIFRRSETNESFMKYALALLCLIGCGGSASAQYGVSNQRDMYGNLPRDGGAYSPRGVNQGPVNNGPIRSTPAPTTTNSAGPINGTSPLRPTR